MTNDRVENPSRTSDRTTYEQQQRYLALACIFNFLLGVAACVTATYFGFPAAWVLLILGVGLIWAATANWYQDR